MSNRDDWSTLHHLAYVYAAIASSDGSISSDELEVLGRKLHEWNPHVDGKELMQIVMAAVATLGEDKGRGDLQPLHASVDLVARALDDDGRTAAIDDLLAIAGADGTVWPAEGDLLLMIREAWEPDHRARRNLRRPEQD